MSGGNSDLTRAILGALILKPSLFEESDISIDDFPAGRFRDTFAGISAQWKTDRPEKIDGLILAQQLGGNGSADFISGLITGQIRYDSVSFRRRLQELRRLFLRSRALAATEKALRTEENTGVIDPDDAERVEALWQELRRAGPSSSEAFDLSSVLRSGAELQALEIRVEWIVKGLLPAHAITLIYGAGGIGKTWVLLQVAHAIAEGGDAFGLQTTPRRVVYIDYENPLPVLSERARKLDLQNVQFWHSAFDTPPRLDGENFDAFKRLPSGSVLCFDTLRAGYSGKENDSDIAAAIMGRMKELRDAGYHPVLLHHTPRANPQASKGSTAFTDLADHTLALYRVRRGSSEEIKDDEGDPGPDALFRFGTGSKTRFEPAEVFLRRSPAGGFVLAEDPDLPLMAGIREYVRTSETRPNQSQISSWAADALGINSKGKIVSLLRRGEGRLWQSRPEGKKNARVYEPL